MREELAQLGCGRWTDVDEGAECSGPGCVHSLSTLGRSPASTGAGDPGTSQCFSGENHTKGQLAKVLGTGYTDQRAWCPVLCPWEDGLCPAEWEWPAGHRLT